MSSILTARDDRVYEVGADVAAGAMGVVRRASDLNIKRSVAMKLMHGAEYAPREQVLRFILEAQVTGQLEHPGIVPVYDLGVNRSGQVFYTMKLLKGVTLAKILDDLRAQKPQAIRDYPLQRLLMIFMKICEAVAFAHSRRVIHRDLKPENVMVADFGEVVVMDWGIAKVLHAADSVPAPGSGSKPRKTASKAALAERINTVTDALDSAGRLTLYGDILGSPAYMAPEQADPDGEEISTPVDIYALGGLLYTILVLHPPVEGTARQMLWQALESQIRPPTDYNPGSAAVRKRTKSGSSSAPGPSESDNEIGLRKAVALRHLPGERVPAALSAVAMKALSRKPEGRYATASDLQADVEAYLSGFATAAEEAGVWTQLRLLVKRHKAEAALLAAALVVIAVIIGVAFVQVTGEKNAAVAARREAVAARDAAGESAAAAQAAREAQVALSKQAAPKFLREAQRLMDLKQWDAALEVSRMATVLDPQLRDAWFTRGLLELGAQQFDGAEEAFDKAASLELPGTDEDRNKAERRKAERYASLAKQCAAIARPRPPSPAAAGSAPSAPSVSSVGSVPVVPATPTAPPPHGTAPVSDKDLAYALAKELQKCGEYLVSARLFEESGKDPAGAANLAMLAATKGLEAANPGLKPEQLEVVEPPAQPGPPEGGTASLGRDVIRFACHDPALVDITALAKTPVTDLDLSLSSVRDLAPLRGLALERLNLARTRITDLAPLAGMPLEELYLDGTAVADLAPLAGMPLKVLDIVDTKVADLTPLAGLKLESLRYTPANIAKGLELVQAMPCAKPVVGRSWTIPDLGMQFVPIAPGKFLREGLVDKATLVTLTKPFWLGKFEVTQAEYLAVTGINPSENKGERLPVEQVDWNEAVAFCARLTERERAAGRLPDGCAYRLPTDAEWEYACRAGTTTTFYFGNDAAALWRFANYRDKSCDLPDGTNASVIKDPAHDDRFSHTAPVGSFEPNAWGLYDMVGNVFEWCQDWYSIDDPAGEVTDPAGPVAGECRVMRGGSWCNSAMFGPSAFRCMGDPGIPVNFLGFRVVLCGR
ncbi:MAG: hypothetical protein A3K19_11560 [Lentisphaerae bacterium RIFOXYB12_FULL_65_16]|nr:MAG: hypothetical protein A3K18_27510 [Lentisphaerae bacterium RIFOXYA12_64_32]OGV88254.1 MAG: hypothetical protein A3K19_11560 [Lentisphaerae bacterium RIFOXYB12_FULL_65_16]